MSDKSSGSIATGRFLGFFTVMLILTLDSSGGKDLLDVIVPYVESLTIVNLSGK